MGQLNLNMQQSQQQQTLCRQAMRLEFSEIPFIRTALTSHSFVYMYTRVVAASESQNCELRFYLHKYANQPYVTLIRYVFNGT